MIPKFHKKMRIDQMDSKSIVFAEFDLSSGLKFSNFSSMDKIGENFGFPGGKVDFYEDSTTICHFYIASCKN